MLKMSDVLQSISDAFSAGGNLIARDAAVAKLNEQIAETKAFEEAQADDPLDNPKPDTEKIAEFV